MANVVPPEIFKAAIRALFDQDQLHLMIYVFGVSVVILLSFIKLWKHVAKGGKI